MNTSKIIMSMILGGFLVFAGTAAISAVALDGESLVQERCSQCHGLGRVDRATFDQAGWETTVDRMIGKRSGLLNAEERDAVVSFLVNR